MVGLQVIIFVLFSIFQVLFLSFARYFFIFVDIYQINFVDICWINWIVIKFKVCSYIKVALYFKNKWIIISKTEIKL